MSIRTKVESFKDKLGNDVFVGDYILYTHNLGRSAALRFGKILDIHTKEEFHDRHGWSITVQGVDDDWSHHKKLCERKGTLLFPNRTIKINYLPDQYKEFFNG